MSNREIKVRAWDTESKSMNREPNFYIQHGVPLNYNGDIFMQYTGLKDKDGRDIYEGDVIESTDSAGNPIRHVIEFDESEGRFAACYLFNGHKDYPGSMRQAWLTEYAKAVIGNIYENPELLKG